MALIEFKNVNKYYGDYHALRDINLEIEKGQVVVILGPSGSGKSTLIRTINALEPIDEGTLIVNGHNVTEASAKDLVELRKEVGMVFQHFNLYPHKTVLENVTLAPIKVLGISKAEAEKTDEQRYSEEQDAIDRQTKKKLQERADAEKMEHLPSEGNTEHKQHEVKIVASYYEDVVSGKKSFELRKNNRGYKQGDSLKMLEFKDGKHTGRTIDADIIYMLEDYTGLTEGYCILGIRVTDYTGKVSETDTESGAEHE